MKIAIIGAGAMARIIAVKAKKMGVRTLCFAWTEGAVAKEYVDVFYPISIFDTEHILGICRDEHIDGVIATTELTISVASFISNEMELNTNPIEIATNVTNKSWVRNKLISAKLISQPQFYYIQNKACFDLDSIASFPVIVKPTSEGGKRGITVAYDRTELTNAIEAAFDADRKENGILIEEYLDGGKEYSVEGLSYMGDHQVIQVTEKISSGPPHCVELGHSQPANITKRMRKQVVSAITEMLNLIGWENGPTHTEVKIINGIIYLIEVNARPGGDHIASPLTFLSTGYDYIAEIIKVAMNIKPLDRNTICQDRFAGVRFVAKQTKELSRLFENCDNEKWLYEKHTEASASAEITHNDCFHLNYFIYCDDDKPGFVE